ncbi:MAG: choice-of-anchor J domain-containing protein [bacterium]
MNTIRYCFLGLILIIFTSSATLAQRDKQSVKSSTGLAPQGNSIEHHHLPPICGSSVDAKSGYLEEGFESTTFPPNDWITYSALGAEVWSRSIEYANSGVASAYIDYQTAGGEDWLITPSIQVSTGANLSFYLRRQFNSSYPPDNMAILISSTDVNIASFVNQVAVIDVANLPASVFNLFTYDLNAYVGQTIYIAFKHTDTDGNGCFLDDIKVGTPPANDVGMLTIDLNQTVPTGPFTPKATVKNYGSAGNSFDVTLKIGSGYTSVKTVIDLAAGTAQQVSFDNANLQLGVYEVVCYTQLASDVNKSNDTLSSNVTIAESKILMGYNAYASGVPTGTVKFSSIAPEELIDLTNITGEDFLAGSALVTNGDIYAIYYDTGQLVKWDTSTGALTNLGVLTLPTGTNWIALTFDPVSEKMYGVAADDYDSYLNEINYQTLTYTPITTFSSTTIICIAANGDGNIYGVELNNDVFGKYNLATGIFTVIGPLGFNANYAQSMEFDYTTGKLYYASYDYDLSAGLLRIIDISTGSSLVLGTFEGDAEIDGLFVPNSRPIPVELTMFKADVINNGVVLEWSTATELNNKGFEIERKTADQAAWQAISFVSGNGTTTEINNYSYVDNSVLNNTTYSYRLKQIDYDGTLSYSQIVEVSNNGIPVTYNLSQNYPNPFNPTTVINYSLPSASYVKLVVTNMLGQEVSTLVNEHQKEGTYNLNFNASSLSSGVYFYSLIVESANGQIFNSVKKMMILK